MAYDSSKEKNTELALLDKNDRGDKVRIAHITVKGSTTEYVDIRTMYTPEGSDEVKPTSKGVRFSSDMLLDMVNALVTVLEPNEVEQLKETLAELDEGESDEE